VSASTEDVPVVFVHGWAGSFRRTWDEPGVAELVRELGRTVAGCDLPGHGESGPLDAERTGALDDADLRRALVATIEDVLQKTGAEKVTAVGFSLGAITLLRIAIDQPHRFRKLVLAGIGATLFDDDPSGTQRIIAGLEGTAAPDDNIARLFAQYGHQPGNDLAALTAVMKRPRGEQLTPELVGRATCETRVIIGDRDFAGPGEPLAAALPAGSLTTLRNVDHFATPESFGFIDATLEFLDAVPA